MTKMEWEPIPMWPNYSVSKTGRIKNNQSGNELKLLVHENLGHLFFNPKRGIKCYVHRAVLQTFVGPCPEDMECRHLDGNPKNNNLNNLKWGTRFENAQDTKKHGRKPKGEKAAFATMSNDDANTVRDYHELGYSSRIIAKMKNTSHTTIQKIIRRERYV